MPEKKEKAKSGEFSTQIIVINSGLAGLDSNFTSREVESLSKERNSQKDKSTKPIPAIVKQKLISFKAKIAAGNKTKKMLKYENFVLEEQLSRDNRIVFIHYRKKKEVCYFVLRFEEESHASKFVRAVSNANPNVIVRQPEESSDDNTDDARSYEMLKGDTTEELSMASSSPITVHEPRTSLMRRSVVRNDDYSPSPPRNHKSSREKSTPHAAPHTANDFSYVTKSGPNIIETFITAGEDEVYNMGNASHTTLTYDEDTAYQRKHSKKSRNKESKVCAKYLYLELAEQEEAKRHSERDLKSKNRRNSLQNYSGPGYDDELEYYMQCPYQKPQPTPRSLNKKSKRPPSRQLPLSEGETAKTGWHSDIIFITPDGEGGPTVSDDGPVMLYTASKTNNYSDDDDDDNSSSDDSDDSEGGYSHSSSTLTVSGDHYYRPMVNGQ